MKLKPLVLGIVLTFIISSCATKKNINSSVFTREEMQLILSGKADEPMRVLLITNPKDSVILRSKSTDFLVSENDTLLQLFTKRLYSTVTDPASRGVGIAAPQVGILKKIIWIKRFDKDDEPFEAYYNPKITKYTDLKQDVLEGCLSIPNVRDTTHYR